MSALPDRSHTAQIVDMVKLLDAPGRRRDIAVDQQGGSAVLLSIRQNLSYQASIGLDGIDSLMARYPRSLVDDLDRQVRELLYTEFGRLRVHRYKQAFSVGHHDLEALVAGLLRVQYYTRQISLPEHDSAEELTVQPALSVAWGVGESISEADRERRRGQGSKR